MSALRLRAGTLRRELATRPGATEWEVAVEESGAQQFARAISYTGLTEPLQPGDRVLLNTTAVALGLGTGGVHFIVCRLGADPDEPPFAGHEAGHQLKLRYTPLQHRVLCVEDEASPHRPAMEAFRSLEGTPVVCCELHSQMAAAAIAIRAIAPDLRLAFIMIDSAALPLAVSRLAHALREQGILAATITTGQAFGGDYEAVTIHNGLIAAREVAGAHVVLAAQGPGNAGTGTEHGFSGLALLEALHAAEALGGRPLLAARISFADTRSRHRGLSHHTTTLARLARCAAEIPLPRLPDRQRATLEEQLAAAGLPGRHVCRRIDASAAWPPLGAFRPALTTMGRSLEEDRAFFLAAAAAGLRAAAFVKEPHHGGTENTERTLGTGSG